MANVLEKIVEDKRAEVELRKQSLPLEQFVSIIVATFRDLVRDITQSVV